LHHESGDIHLFFHRKEDDAMTIKRLTAAAAASAILASTITFVALAGGQSMVKAAGDLKWQDMGSPGVVSAPVKGDLKGPSSFFLRYPVGLETPKHHHTADHHCVVVSGTTTLTLDGKAHRLGPGSWFSMTGGAPHTARVEGNEPVLFYCETKGAWDVVAEK
jgi:mannose-6-phosphate isomerase-like protein (cupin superfamily)